MSKTGFGCASTGFACSILGPPWIEPSLIYYQHHEKIKLVLGCFEQETDYFHFSEITNAKQCL